MAAGGLESLQTQVSNDLRVFRQPFFPDMEEFRIQLSKSDDFSKRNKASGEPTRVLYRVRNLSRFSGFLIGGIVGGERPSNYAESPRLWNPYFRSIGIRGVFFAFDLPGGNRLPEFMRTFLAIPGSLELTITNPYKQEAYRCLAGLGLQAVLDERVRDLGSLNHLLLDRKSRRVMAVNTDGLGLVRAVRERVKISGCRALLIGAGGAAASIGYELVRKGSCLHIANPVEEEAQRLADRLSRFARLGRSISWSGLGSLQGRLEEANLVVSAVSRGTALGRDEITLLPNGALCVDTRYGDQAEFACLAGSLGRRVLDGRSMLFGQFAEAAHRLRRILHLDAALHHRALKELEAEYLAIPL